MDDAAAVISPIPVIPLSANDILPILEAMTGPAAARMAGRIAAHLSHRRSAETWDGEEQGLLGSTEWVEAHASELKKKAIFYLNSGPVTPGHFWAGGSHSLETLVNGVARTVIDPAWRLRFRRM